MQLKVKKLHSSAILPTHATDGSACFDLRALSSGSVSQGHPLVIRTGLAFEVPKDHAMLIFSRSGHGFNYDVRLANCVGVIDSDYRGEVLVKLTADQPAALIINAGERIAQAGIVRMEQVQLLVTDELSETARGTGGLGSTGSN